MTTIKDDFSVAITRPHLAVLQAEQDRRVNKCRRETAFVHVSMARRVTQGLISCASAVSSQKLLYHGESASLAPSPGCLRPQHEAPDGNAAALEDISDDSPLTTPSLMASRPQLKHFCHSGCAKWDFELWVFVLSSPSLCMEKKTNSDTE